MTRTLPMMEARKQLTSLRETLRHDDEIDVMEITRRGKPVLAVMPWELYDAITETLEVMGNKELRALLRQSIKEMEQGKAIPWDEAKLELEL